MIGRTRVVYSFPDTAGPTLTAVKAGNAPRERLFGAVQLLERGWAVSFLDAPRERSLASTGRMWLAADAWKVCSALWRSDILVIQGRLAPLLLFLSKGFGNKVVYIDMLFHVPRNRLRWALTQLCLKLSDAIIGYSGTQAASWSDQFRISRDKIVAVPYPMDSNFYKRPTAEVQEPAFILSVGRDLGRDFDTLLAAARSVPIDVKLVTLPYLIPKGDSEIERVEVFQRLPYRDLFDLYARSKVAIVPLKAGVPYPSGIRAVLEAMLLRTPVVATYTSVLAEYFNDGEHLLYVESSDPKSLAAAIKRLLGSPDLAKSLVEHAFKKVVDDFRVERFADVMEGTLRRLS